MQAKAILSIIVFSILLCQCKKAVSTILPEVGEYYFSVNVKDYDVNGKLEREMTQNLSATLRLNPTQDTIYVEFEKWYEPLILVRGSNSHITIENKEEEFIFNELDCNSNNLKYRMVHKTGIQQYLFEGKKQ
jgi:hypothetical protein